MAAGLGRSVQDVDGDRGKEELKENCIEIVVDFSWLNWLMDLWRSKCK